MTVQNPPPVNELLAYVLTYFSRCSADSIKQAVGDFYTLEDFKNQSNEERRSTELIL